MDLLGSGQNERLRKSILFKLSSGLGYGTTAEDGVRRIRPILEGFHDAFWHSESIFNKDERSNNDS
jgi:hypothetical protein